MKSSDGFLARIKIFNFQLPKVAFGRVTVWCNDGREGGGCACVRPATSSIGQAVMAAGDDMSKGPPQTPVLTVGCRMLRSPSHESVTTDLSLFSVSSLASEAAGRNVKLVTFRPYSERGPSPNPDTKGHAHTRYSRNTVYLFSTIG